MRGEKGASFGVVKFFVVVGLKADHWVLKLREDESVKSDKRGENIGFVAQWKRPSKVREIIQQHKVVFVTRIAYYRRGPNITMQTLKWD